jgi:hypothetical protein
MEYPEKLYELTRMLESVTKRIEQSEHAYYATKHKYGRMQFGRPSRHLYVERDRLRNELECVEYAQEQRMVELERLVDLVRENK